MTAQWHLVHGRKPAQAIMIRAQLLEKCGLAEIVLRGNRLH